jgi:hypothetical protein
VFCSVVNKDLSHKAKAKDSGRKDSDRKAKNLGHKAKDLMKVSKAKDFGIIVTKDMYKDFGLKRFVYLL